MTAVTSVCVFCGASTPSDRRFTDAAAEVGRRLALAGINLVYGGGGLGLMGIVAREAKRAGGRVTGIMPSFLTQIEPPVPGLDELIEVPTMHERKALMFARSDAFLVLPGGIGTIDETIEITTWKQLGLHHKPILLVDIAGYWQPLLALLDHIVERGFARPATRHLVDIVDGVDDILPALRRIAAEPRQPEIGAVV